VLLVELIRLRHSVGLGNLGEGVVGLAAGDVAQLRMGREEDRRRKFRGETIGQIEIDIETANVAASCVRISLISSLENTWPPVACLTCGSGMNPFGNRSRWRMSSGAIWARLSQVTPAGSLTRTPPCTGLRLPDIMTPAIGWSARS
jgi:hypothetical protein